jgi:hypothetical protein
MRWCLDLVYQSNGVVLEGNAAVPFFVGNEVRGPETKLARSFARLEVSGGAEVGPVDIRGFGGRDRGT